MPFQCRHDAPPRLHAPGVLHHALDSPVPGWSRIGRRGRAMQIGVRAGPEGRKGLRWRSHTSQGGTPAVSHVVGVWATTCPPVNPGPSKARRVRITGGVRFYRAETLGGSRVISNKAWSKNRTSLRHSATSKTLGDLECDPHQPRDLADDMDWPWSCKSQYGRAKFSVLREGPSEIGLQAKGKAPPGHIR